jgi:sugar phosphate isomerase/epimerase
MTPLGIVADEINPDFAAAVRIGKPLGLARYEIRFLKTGRAPMCDLAELQEIERIVDGEGLRITALSPGLFKWTAEPAEFHREMAEVYPQAAEWAQRWHLPGLIVFGFRRPGATEENFATIPRAPRPPQIAQWMAAAAGRAAADGLTLLIEPEPISWTDSAAAAVALIRDSGAENLRINYDPGNVAWAQRRDPLDEFAVAAPWIANVHVKDLRWPAGCTEGRPEFVPAGEGIIDFRAHAAALRGIGYQGPLSLEPHIDGREETILRCKAAAERLWQPE